MVAAGTHTIHDRSRGISIWAAALATGGMISPVMGGVLARFSFGDEAFASWRWSFAAVTVLALISALVTLACAADSSAPAGRSLDWPGQITIAIALFALLYAVIQGPTSGWNSGSVNLAFATATAFLVLFVMAEFQSETPLLRLDLFSNRAFSASALVTVFGMFAYLGSGYTTSIRLAAIQGFTPLKTSIAFVMLNGMAWFTVPLVSRSLERYNPRWTLGLGFGLVGVGNLWLSTESATTMSIGPIVAPLLISGIGFAFAISAVTAVAVNTAPKHLAGMASGATSLLRDFGFTLGPAIIGSIALSRAATEISEKVSGNATLARALESFNDSAANAPAGQKAALEAAIGAVNSGPLGANAVPGTITVPDGTTVAFNPLKDVAFHALDHAYSLGYAICAVAALIAALLAAVMLSGNPNELLITENSGRAEKRRTRLAGS
jgi:hypothetical protein